MLTNHAGPGVKCREYTRLSPFEVCRPLTRAKRNPVPANYAGNPGFPTNGVSAINGSNVLLQLLAWELRDTGVVLQAQTWNAPAELFSNGTGGALYEFGGAGNQGPGKPKMLANINQNNGLLPSPQSFLATHINVIIRGDIFQADLLNLAYATYMQFYAGDQDSVYAEGLGAEFPGGEAQVFNGAVGTYAGSLAGIGWPTPHVNKSLRSGLNDPTTGFPDAGYNIGQQKNFRFVIDPRPFSFIASVVATGAGWPTTATASGGKGLQFSAVLRGVLARSGVTA